METLSISSTDNPGWDKKETGCFEFLSSFPSKYHCRDFFCPVSSPFPSPQTILDGFELSVIDNELFHLTF